MQSGATNSASVLAVAVVGDPAAARALIDAIPDALLIHDEQGEILDANRAACLLYGFAHEELLTQALDWKVFSRFRLTLTIQTRLAHSLTAQSSTPKVLDYCKCYRPISVKTILKTV